MFYEGVLQNLAFCLRVGLKTPPKNPKRHPKKHPKSTPNLSRRAPTTYFRKRNHIQLHFLARVSKWSAKGSPEILENRSRTSFFAAQETTDFPIYFYLILYVFEIPRTSKILLKHGTVNQNRRCQPLPKKRPKAEKGHPRHLPRGTQKHRKT